MARIIRRRSAAAPDAPAPDHEPAASADSDSDSLRESLQRARRIAPEVAAATDAVNGALERVEQALTSLNLGVTAAVELEPCRSSMDGWEQYLCFRKDGSTWRLLLESGPMGGDADDYSESPLLNASKEVRLKAIERLPALVDKLVEVAEKHVSQLRAAATKAEALAELLAEAE
jgi:hypothetical protein